MTPNRTARFLRALRRGGAATVALAVLCALGAIAASAAPAEQLAQGERIAREGTETATACAACHGIEGRGMERSPVPLDPPGAVPRIAGQSAHYLAKQLRDFASGARPSTVMGTIAQALSEAERESVAAHYAAQDKVPFPPQPTAEEGLVLQTGGALAALGAPGRGVRACALCHADAGRGIPPAFPYLAGQYADYTERQLLLWKQGARRNDALDVMAEIAAALDEEEIRAVALYFARVRPPLDSLNRYVPNEAAVLAPMSPD